MLALPPSVMPASQSRPSALRGARPEPLTTARTRPGSSAAQASACGPPPEWPMTANRSIPSASAIPATSAAAEATSRPGGGRGAGVAGPVVPHPADAQLLRVGQQRPRRVAGVRRARVPDDGQLAAAGTSTAGAGVIDVPDAPAAQINVGLGEHAPSLAVLA